MRLKVALLLLLWQSIAHADSSVERVGAPRNGGYITAASNTVLTDERTLTGTSNQVNVQDNGAGSTFVLSTPQDIAATSAVTFGTVDTGQGANDLWDMDQNVLTTSAVTFATVNTGEGANELFDMDQNVLTTSTPQFEKIGIGAAASSVQTMLYMSDTYSTASTGFIGIDFVPTISGTGNYRMTGAFFVPTWSSSTSNTNGLYGFQSFPTVGGSSTVTLTEAYGGCIGVNNDNANATITTVRGLQINTPTATGTISNKYSLVTQSGAGNFGIGDVTPDAMLEVTSTTEQLRLTYTNDTVDSRISVDASGNLTIDNTGTKTVISDDLQVTGNDILSSTATAINLSGANVAISGDLVIIGNDIKSATATVGTLSGNDITFADNVSVTGEILSGTIHTIVFPVPGTATTGTNKVGVQLPIPFAGTIVECCINAGTAPTGSSGSPISGKSLVIDINYDSNGGVDGGGTTIWSTQGNRANLADGVAGPTCFTTFNTTTVAAEGTVTVDFDYIGSTIAGSNVTAWLKIRKTGTY